MSPARTAIKFGYIGGFLRRGHREPRQRSEPGLHVQRRPADASSPQSLRVFKQKDRVRYTALYAQDQWTLGRMTLQGALRFDRAWSYSPEQTIGRDELPADAAVVPGDAGRQRVQGHLAARRRGLRRVRQRQDVGQGQLRQVPRAGEQPERQLLDLQSDRAHRHDDERGRGTTSTAVPGGIPGDFIPQCDLQHRRGQRRMRRAWTRPTFGTATRTTAAIDPAILNGWNVRPGDWQIGVSVQQQLLPRVSMEAGYFHRWLHALHDHRQHARSTAADFTPFTLTAPSDPRLPGGGGYPVDRSLQRDARRVPRVGRATTSRSRRTSASSTQVYNGVLVNVTARAANGLTLHGGRQQRQDGERLLRGPGGSAGAHRSVLAGAIVGPTNPFCMVDPGFITKVTGSASYTVPKIDVLRRRDRSAAIRARRCARPGTRQGRQRGFVGSTRFWAARRRAPATRSRSI